jgi:hypothetical protein
MRIASEDRMAAEGQAELRKLQNLAEAMYVDRQLELAAQKRPTANDQDILRAMLGKPLQCKKAECQPSRKAG